MLLYIYEEKEKVSCEIINKSLNHFKYLQLKPFDLIIKNAQIYLRKFAFVPVQVTINKMSQPQELLILNRQLRNKNKRLREEWKELQHQLEKANTEKEAITCGDLEICGKGSRNDCGDWEICGTSHRIGGLLETRHKLLKVKISTAFCIYFLKVKIPLLLFSRLQ